MSFRTVCRQFTRGSLLAAVFMCLMPNQSWAALNGHARITGETQGLIEGDVTQAGREGTIEVRQYSYGVNAPYDPATGLPDGNQQHRPVRLLKRVDQASPLLFHAMTINENLTQVVIEFYRPTQSGAEELFYMVTLTNARVVSISPFQSSFSTDPQMEWIGLTFENIEVEFTDGGITAADNW